MPITSNVTFNTLFNKSSFMDDETLKESAASAYIAGIDQFPNAAGTVSLA